MRAQSQVDRQKLRGQGARGVAGQPKGPVVGVIYRLQRTSDVVESVVRTSVVPVKLDDSDSAGAAIVVAEIVRFFPPVDGGERRTERQRPQRVVRAFVSRSRESTGELVWESDPELITRLVGVGTAEATTCLVVLDMEIPGPAEFAHEHRFQLVNVHSDMRQKPLVSFLSDSWPGKSPDAEARYVPLAVAGAVPDGFAVSPSGSTDGVVVLAHKFLTFEGGANDIVALYLSLATDAFPASSVLREVLVFAGSRAGSNRSSPPAEVAITPFAYRGAGWTIVLGFGRSFQLHYLGPRRLANSPFSSIALGPPQPVPRLPGIAASETGVRHVRISGGSPQSRQTPGNDDALPDLEVMVTGVLFQGIPRFADDGTELPVVASRHFGQRFSFDLTTAPTQQPDTPVHIWSEVSPSDPGAPLSVIAPGEPPVPAVDVRTTSHWHVATESPSAAVDRSELPATLRHTGFLGTTYAMSSQPWHAVALAFHPDDEPYPGGHLLCTYAAESTADASDPFEAIWIRAIQRDPVRFLLHTPEGNGSAKIIPQEETFNGPRLEAVPLVGHAFFRIGLGNGPRDAWVTLAASRRKLSASIGNGVVIDWFDPETVKTQAQTDGNGSIPLTFVPLTRSVASPIARLLAGPGMRLPIPTPVEDLAHVTLIHFQWVWWETFNPPVFDNSPFIGAGRMSSNFGYRLEGSSVLSLLLGSR